MEGQLATEPGDMLHVCDRAISVCAEDPACVAVASNATGCFRMGCLHGMRTDGSRAGTCITAVRQYNLQPALTMASAPPATASSKVYAVQMGIEVSQPEDASFCTAACEPARAGTLSLFLPVARWGVAASRFGTRRRMALSP